MKSITTVLNLDKGSFYASVVASLVLQLLFSTILKVADIPTFKVWDVWIRRHN